MKTGGRKRLRRFLDLALVLLLLLAIVVGATTVARLRHHLTAAQTALQQVEDSLAAGPTAVLQLLQHPEQVDDLNNSLATLDAELAAVDRLASPLLPIAPLFGWLPVIGGDVAAAPHLLAMGRKTTETTRALADGFLPLAQHLVQAEGGLDQLGPELVLGLTQAQPQLATAQAAWLEATASRARLDPSRLSAQTRALVRQFDRFQPLIEGGLRTIAVLPDLLGAHGPRAYLVLAQNSHELRATGGFISGVGLVHIDNGQIAGLEFQDSYTVDDLSQPHPPAPAPLRRYMGAGMLMLRDANWWPHFPDSAQAVADLYRQDQGQEVDGVLAVDLTTLKLLLQALGPVQLQGYDAEVSSGNFEAMLMSFWQAPRSTAPGKDEVDWWQHRKDFAADLMAGLLAHLREEASVDDLIQLSRAASTALQERHLLIYVEADPIQDMLEETGWDGSLLSHSTGDELMVVDSNVGFNKVNPNIDQTVDYQVQLERDGSATARLTLSYRHRVDRPTPACVHESIYGEVYADLMERCYWDYLRIYLPAGSVLLEVLGADEPAEVYQESGRTVIATQFLLQTGQARQIQFLIRPNLSSSVGGYTLWVQKQPGTDALPLRVTVTPPEGSRPGPIASEGVIWLEGQAVWQGDLRQDRRIELSWY